MSVIPEVAESDSLSCYGLGRCGEVEVHLAPTDTAVSGEGRFLVRVAGLISAGKTAAVGVTRFCRTALAVRIAADNTRRKGWETKRQILLMRSPTRK